ncbi:MAG: matrixin family metalloprotease [Polyangiales bacterium]
MLTRSLVVCLALGVTSSARAYCRTYTDDPLPSTCPDECVNKGFPVAWQTPDLHYTFHSRGFPNVSGADLRRIFALSAEAWTEVTCGDEPIGFTLEAEEATTELLLGPKRAEPNKNVIVNLTAEEWAAEMLGNSAYAITGAWFESETGKMVGADMVFNSTMGPFGECPDSGCVAGGPRVDLRNVATHEFGHFLGLNHSEVEGSTMYCSATARDIEKRTLAADDIEGLCAIYPPGESFDAPTPMTSMRGKSEGCALGAEASGGWVLLALLLRRRRR